MEEKPPFFLQVSSIRNNICNNDSAGVIKINVSGGTPPYGILWNGGLFSGTELTKLASDTYQGIISDIKGCRIEILPIKIKSEGNIKLNSQLFHDTNNTQSGKICLSPTGGIPPYLYLWSSQNKKDSCLVDLKGGDYLVTITDGSGCISVHTFRIDNVTAISDRADLKVRFYPNPATDILTIESDKKLEK
ncbi:MAG: SprB repeat-containing protein [Saprospiraceae bacterium]|nr:SprB repeat-containing protein [Saprospiraceae bacterium]